MVTDTGATRREARPFTVLVVEDDEIDRKAIERCLHHIRDVTFVDAVATAAEAMDRLETVMYDIVTLDYNLPDGDGLHLMHVVRELGPKIIFVTGQGGERTAVQAMREGVLDYIIKDSEGVYLSELSQAISDYLDQVCDPYHADRLPISPEKLEMAMETLRGVLPICYSCKKIRNGSELWIDVEAYFRQLLNVRFSHGLCPECYEKQRDNN